MANHCGAGDGRVRETRVCNLSICDLPAELRWPVLSTHEPDNTLQPKKETPLSIVDLIIQEQLESNNLILAPRPVETEPELDECATDVEHSESLEIADSESLSSPVEAISEDEVESQKEELADTESKPEPPAKEEPTDLFETDYENAETAPEAESSEPAMVQPESAGDPPPAPVAEESPNAEPESLVESEEPPSLETESPIEPDGTADLGPQSITLPEENSDIGPDSANVPESEPESPTESDAPTEEVQETYSESSSATRLQADPEESLGPEPVSPSVDELIQTKDELFAAHEQDELLLGPSEDGQCVDFLIPTESDNSTQPIQPPASDSGLAQIADPDEKRRLMEELLNQRFAEVAPPPPAQAPEEVFEKLREFEVILNERFAEVAPHPQHLVEITASETGSETELSSVSDEAPEQAESPEEGTKKASDTPSDPSPPNASPQSVGGSLRELEEALTRKTEAVLPQGFRERALPAITLLARLPGVQRALVMVEDSSGELRCVARAGIDGDDYLQRTPVHLMKSVLRTKEPILMLDTARDPRFAGDKIIHGLGVASGLCVPYSDCVSGGRGVLYADNLNQTNVFTHKDFGKLKEFCKRLANDRDLGEFELPATATATPAVLHIETPQPISPKWVALALCAIVLIAWPSFGNPPKKPENKPSSTQVQPVRQTTDPKTVALSFFRAIETRNFRSAYDYLSDDLQKSVELERFSQECEKFLDSDSNSWLLMGLSLIDRTARNDRIKNFGILNAKGEQLDWKVTLAKIDDSWFITEVDGIPGISF